MPRERLSCDKCAWQESHIRRSLRARTTCHEVDVSRGERCRTAPICALAAYWNARLLHYVFVSRKVTGVAMVRTNFKFAQLRDRRRRATPIRRYAWKPRSAPASRVASRQFNSAFASGEFESSRHVSPTWILWRSFGLASDIIVLTLASPFFAVWWSWRMMRRLFGAGH